MVKEGLALT